MIGQLRNILFLLNLAGQSGLRTRDLRHSLLKRHNQAKIIKKSVFIFWLLTMAVRCEHVHRLELRNFVLNFVLRIYKLGEKYGRNLISDMH